MEKTKARRNYLRTWLDRHREASQVAPVVGEALEEAEWELRVLRDRPADAHGISTAEVDAQASRAFDLIADALPQMPDYELAGKFLINSLSTNSTSAAFFYVQQVADVGTQATTDYALALSDEYRQLQETHHRRAKVRDLIQDVVPAVLDRFNRAHHAVEQFRVGTGTKSAAASEIRNLVDGLQGELFQKARRSPRENMTWREMANRLVPGSKGTNDAVVHQERVKHSLYEDLSQVAKLREGRTERRIEDLRARAIDHVFTVLSSVKSSDAV